MASIASASDDEDDSVEYDVEEFSLTMKDGTTLSLNLTTVAYMPITTLLANREKNIEISGQKLWCGSLCVAQFLVSKTACVEASIVVELGAGTGFLGMVCAKLGAEVFLTDHDERSLENMAVDCANNFVENTMILALDWFNLEAGLALIAESVARTPEKPVVLLAGDVLYKHALIRPFIETVRSIFSCIPTCKDFYLCHVPRAGVTHEAVLSGLADLMSLVDGLTLSEIPRSLWEQGDCMKYCEQDDLSRAQLYIMSR